MDVTSCEGEAATIQGIRMWAIWATTPLGLRPFYCLTQGCSRARNPGL
jgi:hypothetical protein